MKEILHCVRSDGKGCAAVSPAVAAAVCFANAHATVREIAPDFAVMYIIVKEAIADCANVHIIAKEKFCDFAIVYIIVKEAIADCANAHIVAKKTFCDFAVVYTAAK